MEYNIKRLWKIEYVIDKAYGFKLLYAKTEKEAIKKSKVDPQYIVEVSIEKEEQIPVDGDLTPDV